MVLSYALLAAAGAAAVVLGVRDLWVPTGADHVRRAATSPDRPRSSLAGRLVERVGRPLAPVLRHLGGGGADGRLARRIDAAGRPDGTGVERFLARRAGVVMLGASVAGVYVVQGRAASGVALGAVVAVSADASLHLQARRRQGEIEQALPDLIDALTVSIAAGSAFRPTLQRLCERWDGPAAEELATTLRMLDVGTGRRTAFLALQTRNTSPALRQFAAAVIQAEELGTSISTTLRSLSEQMRRTAGQRARQRADGIEKRIILINAALFLPAMMVMLVTVSLLGFGVAGAFSS